MIVNYNDEVVRWQQAGKPLPVEDFITKDSTEISWARSLRQALGKQTKLAFDEGALRQGIYRPFQKQHVYFAPLLNHERGQQPRFFPSADRGTVGFYIVGPGNDKGFSALATSSIPDLSFWGSGQGQFFARYSYAASAPDALFDETEKQDNITDWALGEYQNAYGVQVTKDEIFYYVYGLLHSPEYRERYAADLKKQLPRIPQVAGRGLFDAFVDAGRKLADLHINYENLTPYELAETILPGAPEDEYERFAVTKMKYSGKAGAWDKSRIRYNQFIDIEDIPAEAQEYMLGSRSGLDWILERYQIKTDKASGIINDPNDCSWDHQQPRYIIDLVGRIVTLSLETNRIIQTLPELKILRLR